MPPWRPPEPVQDNWQQGAGKPIRVAMNVAEGGWHPGSRGLVPLSSGPGSVVRHQFTFLPKLLCAPKRSVLLLKPYIVRMMAQRLRTGPRPLAWLPKPSRNVPGRVNHVRLGCGGGHYPELHT